jgi:hypothetical protein
VQDWDAYFFKDVDRIASVRSHCAHALSSTPLTYPPQVWPSYGHNTQDVGSLVHGFAVYYVSFDFGQHVVGVAKPGALLKTAKDWQHGMMCIEGA